MENNLLNFKVSTHLKDIIGRDLVTDKYVAIFELVKNSVDANAKHVEVVITKNQIIIGDDGSGMTLNDIQNKWFFIGYSEKKDSEEMFAGSKGIGRFSADNLAKQLVIKTNTKNSRSINVDLEWSLFEKNQLDEINGIDIPYSFGEVKEKSGTTLILTGLRNSWSEKDIEKLQKSLAKIFNPFEEEKGVKINLRTDYSEMNGLIGNDILEVINEKSIVLDVMIKDSCIKCNLIHNQKQIVSFSYYQESTLENVSFRVYHLSQAAKSNFTRRMGIDYKNYGNIFVYRNRFRVYPYGETYSDLFQLNLRKSQGYNRYLGLRDIIGSISIIDTKEAFKEVSSRDNGFVANHSYLELQDIYLEFHRFLEDFMHVCLFNKTTNYEINFDIIKRFKKKDKLVYELGIKENFIEYKDVIEKIDRNIPLSNNEKKVIKDEKIKVVLEEKEVEDVKKENKLLKKKNNELEKEITIKNILIDSDNKTNSVNREMFNHHINTSINDLKSIIEELKSENKGLLSDSSFIEFQEEYFNIIQKLIALKGIAFSVQEESIGSKKNNIVHFINEYSKSWSLRNDFKITVYAENIVFEKDYDIIYLVVVLDNLFENASTMDASKIDLSMYKDGRDLIVEVISRDSCNKTIEIDNVFNFGYTTKKRGTGMGMFFVRKLVEEELGSTVRSEIKNNSDFVTIIRMGL